MFLRAHHHHDVFKAILKKPEEWEDKLWTSSEEYKSETNFDQAFEMFLQEKIISAVFPKGVEYISQDQFVAKFTKKNPCIFKKKKHPTVEWLFSPVGVYFNYRPYLDEVNKNQDDLCSQTDFINSFIVDEQAKQQCLRGS